MMTDMDVDKAAKMTYELARQYHYYWRSGTCRELSFGHLKEMIGKWDDLQRYEKKCRWLGWMQAMVVSATHPHTSMQDMKEINIECSNGKENYDQENALTN